MKYNRVQQDEDFEPVTPPLGFSVKQSSSHIFSVHINTEIKDPSHYSRIFDLLLEAGEEDVVTFFICSPGGRLDGLTTLLEGIRLTDAHVVAVVIGEAHSAASLLALNCHEVVVTDSATMLCHAVNTGYRGKLADLGAYTEHVKKTANALFADTYAGFLEPSEITSVQEGKELWLDAEEIRERLENRTAYYMTMQEEENEDQPTTTPGDTEVRSEDRRSKGKKK